MDLEIIGEKYSKIIIETEDKKEVLAEITNKDIKSANNIQVRLMPKD